MSAEDIPNEPSKKAVNTQLRKARLKRLWSIKVAAKRVGISETTYIRWEQGDQYPHLVNLQALCNTFELSPKALGYGFLVGAEDIESQHQNPKLAKMLGIKERQQETIRQDPRILSGERLYLEQTQLNKSATRARLETQLRVLKAEQTRLEAEMEQAKLEESRARVRLQAYTQSQAEER